jgi:hypothetical protein
VTKDRLPNLTGFAGPGHKRHAFYGAVSACGIKTGSAPLPMLNHTDPYHGGDVSCARCKKMLERILCGVTPDHLHDALGKPPAKPRSNPTVCGGCGRVKGRCACPKSVARTIDEILHDVAASKRRKKGTARVYEMYGANLELSLA